ncbi:MAG: sulfurtransferase TusA family protein [Gemmataceae bacterium]
MDPTASSDPADAPAFVDDESLPLRELRRLAGGRCARCRTNYTPHEAVFSVALGFKSAPRCLPCLALGLGRNTAELKAQVTDYILRRDCYRAAWAEAERLGGPDATPGPVSGIAAAFAEPDVPAADQEWDAGDMGCGELVLALRMRLNPLPGGTVLAVRATDPAAPEDLPAWCGLTGHTLVSADHPRYLIRRK